MQALLDTLTYSYTLVASEEPVEGERLVLIVVSDGIFESAASIAIDVVALNNHPPQISFSGSFNVTFTEGQTEPISLGSLLAPVVSDPDNNTLFLMQTAVVQLLQATDGEFEELNFDPEAVSAPGISVNRKPLLPKMLFMCDVLHSAQ